MTISRVVDELPVNGKKSLANEIWQSGSDGRRGLDEVTLCSIEAIYQIFT